MVATNINLNGNHFQEEVAMATSAPKCQHVSDVYSLDVYPTEDRIRTPDMFEDQIKHFDTLCAEAKDQIRRIDQCVPECRKAAADAEQNASDLEDQIEGLNN